METTTILGTGAVGTALGILLARANWPLAGVWSRNHDNALTASLRLGCSAFPEPAEPLSHSTVALITVSDRAVGEVFQKIRPHLRPDTLVIHTSGNLGPEVLDGVLALAMHPLQSIPNAEAGVQRLPGSFFTLQGPPAALERGTEMVRAFQGTPLALGPLDRHLYHAAATLISTSLVTSFALAQELWPGDQTVPALLPLALGTLDNLREHGPHGALTGPAVRHDWETVAAHWQALADRVPHGQGVYRALTEAAVKLKGLKGEVPW